MNARGYNYTAWGWIGAAVRALVRRDQMRRRALARRMLRQAIRSACGTA